MEKNGKTRYDFIFSILLLILIIVLSYAVRNGMISRTMYAFVQSFVLSFILLIGAWREYRKGKKISAAIGVIVVIMLLVFAFLC